MAPHRLPSCTRVSLQFDASSARTTGTPFASATVIDVFSRVRDGLAARVPPGEKMGIGAVVQRDTWSTPERPQVAENDECGTASLMGNSPRVEREPRGSGATIVAESE